MEKWLFLERSRSGFRPQNPGYWLGRPLHFSVIVDTQADHFVGLPATAGTGVADFSCSSCASTSFQSPWSFFVLIEAERSEYKSRMLARSSGFVRSNFLSAN